MAKVTLSGIITDINGSINGWTFQNCTSGKMLRTKPNQVRNFIPFPVPFIGGGSVPFVQAREIPTLFRFIYQTFTPTEKADWATYASVNPFVDIYGNVKTLSGYQFAYSCILRQFLMGATLSSSPPVAVPAPDAMDSYTLVLDATSIVLTFSIPFIHANNQCWVYLSLPTHANNFSNRRLFKFISIFVPPNALTVDITSAWETRTGLTWATVYNYAPFNILSSAFLAREESGITSLAVFALGSI